MNKTTNKDALRELLSSINQHRHYGPNTAHIEIDGNKVLGRETVPGMLVDVQEDADKVKVNIKIEDGIKIDNPVHLCFGILPESGDQKINLTVTIGEHSAVEILAHCTFPNATNVLHQMDAAIHLMPYASYSYFERHIHSENSGIKVVPKAEIILEEGARFKTEFELLKGRVGNIDIDYTTLCKRHSVLEMVARIYGKGDDYIRIREAGKLVGEYARGVLISNIAVREKAYAEIYNDLVAQAPYATGHVDCKEIVQDDAVARAIPIVQVNHPKAHVTHEAAIGSVDSKQLQTLMSRGLTEDDAVEMIIQGMLR